MKIAVGLSGGVDSTIAAYLLKKEGHDIVGLTMKIWDDSYMSTSSASACFGPDESLDIEEASKVCADLGIPYHVADLSKEYKKNIIGYFKDEYSSGRTPNPCVKCNQMMKFQLLVDKARENSVDFEYFATGHYANVDFNEESGRWQLRKGADPKKDQSYFLSLLKQEQLKQILFPLGKYRKEEVKDISRQLGLTVHEKKESQDFFAGNYDELLDSLPPVGEIVDSKGKVLGNHKGICYYTVGQRKGLGVSHSEPLYVIRIDKGANRIVVGTESELYGAELTVSGINWIAIERLKKPTEYSARIRYKHQEAPALITPLEENRVRIEFKEPQKSIAPGQYALIYDGDIVVGGGVID